jgi:hypothetical protein
VRNNRIGPKTALLLILAATVTLRTLFFSGFVLSDDTYYIKRAHELSTGSFSPPRSHFEARLGIVAPPALAFRLFGASQPTTVLLPLLCSTLTPLAGFLLGRMLFSPATGLLAATLLAFFPMEIIFASRLFACAQNAFLIAVALLAFLKGEQDDDSRYSFLAGVTLGLAVIVHEVALFTIVFLPFYFLFVRPPARRHVAAAVGLLAICAIDPLVNAWMAGDPFLRLRLVSANGTVQGSVPEVAGAGFNFAWLSQPILRLLTEQELGLFPYAIIPVTAMALVRPRHRNDRVLALWVASIFLWLSYGTVSPTGYAPLARVPRYLAPLTVPAVVLLAAHLSRWQRPAIRYLLVAALCVTSLVCAVADNGRGVARPYEDLHAHLQAAPPEQLVVESGMLFPVLFYERFAPPFAAATTKGPWDGKGELQARDAWPQPGESRSLASFRGAHVAVRATPARDWLATRPRFEHVATFHAPYNLQQWLLDSPTVMRLLAPGRPEFRMRHLADPERRMRIELYRIRE